VAGECVRSLRRLGLRDEIDKLLSQLLDAILGKASFKDLKSKYVGKADQWLKALQAMLNVASGWLTFGLMERALPILDEARTEILSPVANKTRPQDFTNLVRAYVSAVGHGPTENGLHRILEIFHKMEPSKVTNPFTTGSFYSRFHLNITEDVVLAVVSDDFALGSAGRRWLEDDEFLVRQRIHRDMRTILAGSGL
jgi:cellulose synthase operon protein C